MFLINRKFETSGSQGLKLLEVISSIIRLLSIVGVVVATQPSKLMTWLRFRYDAYTQTTSKRVLVFRERLNNTIVCVRGLKHSDDR